MLDITASKIEDAALIEPRLEADCRLEVQAWVPPGLERVLIEEGIRQATEAHTIWERGRPLGIMAYRLDNLVAEYCSPWAVWAEEVTENPRRQAGMARGYYDELVGRFGLIRNTFRDDLPKLHKWAELMGATVLRNTGEVSPTGAPLAIYERAA